VSAHKALALCERHGLTSAARALCARLSSAASDAGLPGAALRWALRGGDGARAAALAAPVLGALAEQLEARSGDAEAAPLDLPALDELGPLLDCLPPVAPWGADGDGGGDDADGGFSFPLTAARRERVRRAGRRGGGARVAMPELQALRAVGRLQAALRALAAARAGGGSAATLQEAYRAARQPVMDLLGLPLAPLALRLPLLRFALPLLETTHMPFARADVQRLLQVLGAALAALAAARADGVAPDDGGGDGGGGGGGGGGSSGAEAAGLGPSGKVGEVRLALARALARAHIAEASAEA
jgi:hypothetical protein